MTVLRCVTFNAAGAMPSDRRGLGRRCLEAASRHGAFLGGVECDDLLPEDLEEILGPAWWWIHGQSERRDGLLVAGRHDRTHLVTHRYMPGADRSPVNAARPILRTRIVVDQQWGMTTATLHVPRRGEGGFRAHRQMLGNTRGIGADLLEGDFNRPRKAMRDTYPERRIASAGVIHAAASRRLVLTAPKPFDLVPGTRADDHKGLAFTVRRR